MPDFLADLTERLRALCVSAHASTGDRAEAAFDQCTVNEYQPGHGIASHVDTHSAFGSMLASLSLQARVVMTFVHAVSGERLDLVLPRRSLLVLSGEARYEWTHGIGSRTTDLVRRRRGAPFADGERADKVILGDEKELCRGGDGGVSVNKDESCWEEVLLRRRTRLSVTLRRLRQPQEGPCRCAGDKTWCDSAQGSAIIVAGVAQPPPGKRRKKT